MGKVIYSLPTSVEVDGTEYAIQSDYRAILDILVALTDRELDERDKAEAALTIFYPDFEEMPVSDYQEALNQCFRFIDHGQENREKRKQPEIMSWAQDFDLYIAPINRIAGCEVRALEYLHWYSFLSYYQEIGDCLYAQVVSIRDKKARGKSLDKQERDFYRRNRDIVDLKITYSEAEADLLAVWGVGTKTAAPVKGRQQEKLIFYTRKRFRYPRSLERIESRSHSNPAALHIRRHLSFSSRRQSCRQAAARRNSSWR